MLKFTIDNSIILGVDLGGTKLQAGLIENGKLSQVRKKEINAQGTRDEVLAELFEFLEFYDLKKIDGIGIGIPSVVDIARGIVYDVNNIPSWQEVHLKEMLGNRYGIPARVNNDANVFVVGEKYFGSAREYKHVAGVTLGTGMGTGLILNDKLYCGMNCGAGEFGMIPHKDKILEAYSSGQFFHTVIGMSGEQLFGLAEAGDEKAKQAFSEYGTHLGEALKMIIYAVDPEIIILGGSVSKAFPFFKEAMFAEVNALFFTKSAQRIKIVPSQTEFVALYGAAALFFQV
jgi:glucokinase